ncbi:MAG: histidine triad nucleotide-binding protein [Candidatus Zixiibacteriota bacterium]|nr:MAG: histidine triad nucleotide-binding protein [candidate division Zixibacteria bacterium]
MFSIFTKIVNRELPAKIFYETDDVIVIADHHSKALVHLLIIPKVETKNFYQADKDILTLLDQTVKIVAEKLKIEDYFRIQINNGFGQEINHLHYHFLSTKGAENLKFIE